MMEMNAPNPDEAAAREAARRVLEDQGGQGKRGDPNAPPSGGSPPSGGAQKPSIPSGATPEGFLVNMCEFITLKRCRTVAARNGLVLTHEQIGLIKYSPEERSMLEGLAPGALPFVKEYMGDGRVQAGVFLYIFWSSLQERTALIQGLVEKAGGGGAEAKR